MILTWCWMLKWSRLLLSQVFICFLQDLWLVERSLRLLTSHVQVSGLLKPELTLSLRTYHLECTFNQLILVTSHFLGYLGKLVNWYHQGRVPLKFVNTPWWNQEERICTVLDNIMLHLDRCPFDCQDLVRGIPLFLRVVVASFERKDGCPWIVGSGGSPLELRK